MPSIHIHKNGVFELDRNTAIVFWYFVRWRINNRNTAIVFWYFVRWRINNRNQSY